MIGGKEVRIKKYLMIINKKLQNQTIFRTQFISEILIKVFDILLFSLIVRSIFNKQGNMGDYKYHELINYFIISRALSVLFTSKTMINIAIDIRSGNIVYDFLKPINYISLKFAEMIGESIIPNSISSLAIMLIGSQLLDINNFTLSLGIGTLIIFTIITGILIMFFIDFLLGLLAFYTRGFYGIRSLKSSLFLLFSGAILPIEFYPQFLRNIVEILPFHTMVRVPANLFISKMNYMDVQKFIIIESSWLLILYFTVVILFNKAKKRLVIHGG